MKEHYSRRTFLGQVSSAGAAAGAAAIIPAAKAQDSGDWELETNAIQPLPNLLNPDPQNMRQTARGWRLRPTGGDDHDNLEWALRHTPAGGTVRLTAGTFKVGSTVVVPNFDGNLIGAGSKRTTLTCIDEFSYEVWEAPGGGRDQGEPVPPRFPRVPIEGTQTRAAPGVILFYKTPLMPGETPEQRANRIEIRGMRCRGAMLGDDWTFGDEVLCFTVANTVDWFTPETIPVTTRQDVLITDVEVDGYRTPAFPVFENACACITVIGGLVLTNNYDLEGIADGDMFGASNGALLGVVPAEGNVTFSDCTFRNCRLGPGVVGYKDGRLLFDNIQTENCRGNCLQLIDNSGCQITVRDCNLLCDSFLLPPELTVGGATDVPSSLGCVAALQGATATVGIYSNLRWLTLAVDPAAHAAHPEAGPIGTWRPLGPAFAASAPCKLRIVDTVCQSSATPNTYCFHVVDLSNFAFGIPSIDARISDNSCGGSQTCVSLEHVTNAVVRDNRCRSQEFGVELYNSPNAKVRDNKFKFESASGCEIRVLVPGEKIDLSRVVPDAGLCWSQG
jgi:hypothetical protein